MAKKTIPKKEDSKSGFTVKKNNDFKYIIWNDPKEYKSWQMRLKKLMNKNHYY